MSIPVVGWKGQCVCLVPPDRSLHFENALRWMNDPEITATLEFNLGMSRKQEEAFFDRIEGPNDTDFTWAILDQSSRHIGFIGLHAINWRHRAATGGILIGERSAWGSGYATDAVRVRTQFAFAQLGLHKSQRPYLQPGDEARLREVRLQTRGHGPENVLARRAMV